MRGCALLLALAVLLGGCGGGGGPEAVKAEGLPGYVVEADGHKVYFECRGKGSPTVVFVSGWGIEAATWLSVFDESARLTRSCRYDRYGIGLTAGYGELPPKTRDAKDQVRELERLLENGDIAKPYVLVGHSWGGALSRLYAGEHDEVKGVVFVDSSTPGQDTALLEALPPERPDEPAVFAELRHAHTNPLDDPEHLDWGKSLEEVREIDSLGDRPEVVITAGGTFSGDAAALAPVWTRLQDDLAGISTHSVHVRAPSATHFVQNDAPEVVQAGIDAVVKAVREDGKLGSCGAIFGGISAARCV